MRQLILAVFIITLVSSCKKKDCPEKDSTEQKSSFTLGEISYTADSFISSNDASNFSVQSFANGGAIINIQIKNGWPTADGVYTYKTGIDTPQIEFLALSKYITDMHRTMKCDTPTTATLVVNNGKWTLNMPLTQLGGTYNGNSRTTLDLSLRQ